MSGPFPHLTPTARTGRLRCGSHPPDMPDHLCGQSAAWHVAWTLTVPARFSLLCDRHMASAQRDLVYSDRHPVTVECDMPGTGWLPGDPSRCVIAPDTKE